MSYIYGQKAFREMYRELSDEDRRFTCLILHLSDDQDLYLTELRDWTTIPSYCKERGITISSISLQHRSNNIDIDTSDVDGLYIVQTAKGMLGGDVQVYVTVGKVYGSVVKKDSYNTPALLIDNSCEDKVEDCIEEALFIYEKQA